MKRARSAPRAKRFFSACSTAWRASASASRRRRPRRSRATTTTSSPTCARSRCRAWSMPEHLPLIAEAKAVLHWHAAPPLLPELRRADASRAGRLEARLPAMQGRAFPAHRSGGDHAGDHRRSMPARPFTALPADHVVVPCRLHRAGRSDRGRGAAGNARGSRHYLRPRASISTRSPGRSPPR